MVMTVQSIFSWDVSLEFKAPDVLQLEDRLVDCIAYEMESMVGNEGRIELRICFLEKPPCTEGDMPDKICLGS